MSKVEVLCKLTSYVEDFCRQPTNHQLVLVVGTLQSEDDSKRENVRHQLERHYKFHLGWYCPLTEDEHSQTDQKRLALNLITRLNNQCDRTGNSTKLLGRSNNSIQWTMIPQTKGFYTYYQGNVVQTNYEDGKQEHHITKTTRCNQFKTSRPWDLQVELHEHVRLPDDLKQKPHDVQLILSSYKNIRISIFHHAAYNIRINCFDDVYFEIMIHISKIVEPSRNKFDSTQKKPDYIPKVELLTPPKLSHDPSVNDGLFKYVAEVLLEMACLLCGSTMKHTDQTYSTLPPIQLSLFEM